MTQGTVTCVCAKGQTRKPDDEALGAETHVLGEPEDDRDHWTRMCVWHVRNKREDGTGGSRDKRVVTRRKTRKRVELASSMRLVSEMAMMTRRSATTTARTKVTPPERSAPPSTVSTPTAAYCAR